MKWILIICIITACAFFSIVLFAQEPDITLTNEYTQSGYHNTFSDTEILTHPASPTVITQYRTNYTAGKIASFDELEDFLDTRLANNDYYIISPSYKMYPLETTVWYYLWRSALLPGWGQVELGRSAKAGAMFGVTGLLISLGAVAREKANTKYLQYSNLTYDTPIQEFNDTYLDYVETHNRSTTYFTAAVCVYLFNLADVYWDYKLMRSRVRLEIAASGYDYHAGVGICF